MAKKEFKAVLEAGAEACEVAIDGRTISMRRTGAQEWKGSKTLDASANKVSVKMNFSGARGTKFKFVVSVGKEKKYEKTGRSENMRYDLPEGETINLS